jgi:hypothetical protein
MTCASFGCKAATARSTPAASSLVWAWDEAAGLSLDVVAYAAPQEHTRGQRRGEERPAMDHSGIVPPRARLRDADGVG